jgi:uncharacterized membrane protein
MLAAMSATTIPAGAASGAGPSRDTSVARYASIDIIRGAVMVLMAIDHVRVYSGLPAGGPTPGIFFTRWVTHFCAPAFIFLAGTSAFLYGRTHTDLPKFLLSRGAWLILLELTVIRLAWTFNFDFANYLLAGVIWVIGWSMILLALAVKLPVKVVGAIGLAMIFGHDLLPVPGGGPVWTILHAGFWNGPIGPLAVLYTIIPWAGVMMAGYAFGTIVVAEPDRRRRLCLQIGLGATALFVVLRGFNLYGEPRAWSGEQMPAWLSFLNTSKYPASLQFLLMTLGPTIALVPLLENARGLPGRVLAVFGRVPFFFYLLHIPLIHVLALMVSWLREGSVNGWLFANHPMGNPPPPEGYGWSLPVLYAVWAVAVALLYPPSAWFAGLKARTRSRWLSYL